MTESIRDAAIRHVDDIAIGQKKLMEKALYMRCQSYLANVKAQLLTKTIYEVEDQRKELKEANLSLRATMDTLQRKQEELAAEVARRKAIVQNSSAGILVVNGDRTIAEANPRLLEMTGYAESDLVGQPASQLHQDGEAFARFYHRIREAEQGDGHFIDYPLRHKDGRLVCCELSGRLIDPRDPGQGMVCVCVDVSERRRAEAERQEREQRLATLIEALPDAIWFKDGEGRWREVNSAGIRLFRMEDKPWQGRTEAELAEINPELGEAHLACAGSDERAWALAQPVRGEETIIGEDGERRFFEVVKVPLQDAAGERQAMVIVGRDVTLQRRNEGELIEARDQAEAANRAKSSFLANMSHELRTPLNAMLGYAQILGRHRDLGGEQREAVEIIQRSGDHLLTLINDVLDLAKVEAGRFDLIPGPCELRPFFLGMDELFRIRAQEKGLAFRFQVEGRLPSRVLADERRLRQIVMNLLGNAVKFTEQGEVRLDTGYRDGILELRVEDTGIGIPPDRIGQLFQPFQQAHGSEYRSRGTGLGLAIARSLVEQMGGELAVESAVGQGSRFTLRLPLPALHERDDRPPLSAQQIQGYRRRDGQSAPLRLLLVDDVMENRGVLRGLLTPLGFTCDEAGDGGAALEAVLRQRPDLVLMDLVMPGVNGLEATRLLHALVGCSALPVVAVSASAFAEDRRRSLEAGCADHLAKPVVESELLDSLGRLLALEWYDGTADVRPADGPASAACGLTASQRADLLALAKRGDIRRLRASLAAIEAECGSSEELRALQLLAKNFDLKKIRARLER